VTNSKVLVIKLWRTCVQRYRLHPSGGFSPEPPPEGASFNHRTFAFAHAQPDWVKPWLSGSISTPSIASSLNAVGQSTL
jgi:hypothetical protein